MGVALAPPDRRCCLRGGLGRNDPFPWLTARAACYRVDPRRRRCTIRGPHWQPLTTWSPARPRNVGTAGGVAVTPDRAIRGDDGVPLPPQVVPRVAGVSAPRPSSYRGASRGRGPLLRRSCRVREGGRCSEPPHLQAAPLHRRVSPLPPARGGLLWAAHGPPLPTRRFCLLPTEARAAPTRVRGRLPVRHLRATTSAAARCGRDHGRELRRLAAAQALRGVPTADHRPAVSGRLSRRRLYGRVPPPRLCRRRGAPPAPCADRIPRRRRVVQRRSRWHGRRGGHGDPRRPPPRRNPPVGPPRRGSRRRGRPRAAAPAPRRRLRGAARPLHFLQPAAQDGELVAALDAPRRRALLRPRGGAVPHARRAQQRRLCGGGPARRLRRSHGVSRGRHAGRAGGG